MPINPRKPTSEAQAYQMMRRCLKKERDKAQKDGKGDLVSGITTFLNEFNCRNHGNYPYISVDRHFV